jgi:SpoVK/Ycf46/Vps4 family AAA+-type ATPase
MTFYRTDAEYLLDELKKLDLLIHLFILKSRLRREAGDPFAGLYISEEEVDALLDDDAPPEDPRIRALAGKVGDMERAIELKAEKSLEEGFDLRLPRLVRAFDLSEFEKGAVVICAAAELDAKYERLYAYLQDDLTKKKPTIGLILNLLCDDPLESMKSRGYFAPHGTLLKRRIMEVFFEDSGPSLSSAIRLDPEVLAYILGEETRPEKPKGRTDLPLEDLFSEKLRATVKNLILHLRGCEGGKICLLQGPPGAGKKAVAELMCREIGLSLHPIDLAALATREGNFEAALSRSFRDVILRGSAAYLEGLDIMNSDPNGSHRRGAVFRSLEDFTGLAFVATQDAEDPLGLDGRRQMDLFRVEVPSQDYAMRKRIWERHLKDRLGEGPDESSGEGADEDLAGQLAGKFRFTAGQIDEAVAAARNRALQEGREKMSPGDFYEGCRSMSSRGLSSLARKIDPKYTWEDIVLPEDKMRQLREIQVHVRHKGLVYHDWGFEEKLSLGRGLNVLFSGPSGTGKTMAAEVIAKELEIDLYKIDLSMVVSKYIGETEKNLNKIFKEAERSNAILFFDEADALFGKRSEVKDAHDRYANVEIGYLLQKMEEHEGIAILATNLGKNIDDAFLRRMHFIVEFPFPEEEYRLRIWGGLTPKIAPISEDVDFQFLAKKFKISGGNIKNVMINAAFLAAEDSKVITMEHVILATRDEFLKMGKLCIQSDFGKYYNLIM